MGCISGYMGCGLSAPREGSYASFACAARRCRVCDAAGGATDMPQVGDQRRGGLTSENKILLALRALELSQACT